MRYTSVKMRVPKRKDFLMDIRFYTCEHCHQIMVALEKKDVPVVCCGEPVSELILNSSEGAPEMHMPVYEIQNDKVVAAVGAVAHPMTEEHHIEWIALQTTSGIQSVRLKPGEKPEAVFPLNDSVEHVYAFCNIHGMWKE